ncbi:MAG: hypothetical protein ABI960_05815 [Candidatus Eisenbacteria bacterium]
MNLGDRLEKLDRRWIFLLVGILVLLPLLFPLKLPIAVSGPASRFYEAVNAIPDGSIVVVSGDFDPASGPELMPMLTSAVRHLYTKNCKVIALELWPGGPPLVDGVLHSLGDAMGKKYGVDYVNLGYKSGNEVVMLAFGSSFSRTFPNDYSGTAVNKLPLMQSVDNFDGVKLLINISAGYPGTKEWVQQAQGRYHIRMVSGSTAVQAPELYPYLQSGQIIGLLGGMAGAAEYEKTTGVTGPATKGMDAQSSAHVFIMILILIGNVIYFSRRAAKS